MSVRVVVLKKKDVAEPVYKTATEREARTVCISELIVFLEMNAFARHERYPKISIYYCYYFIYFNFY